MPNKASKNVDVALKLNADNASKDDDIDVVRGNFPANHGILKDAGTVTRRRNYKDKASKNVDVALKLNSDNASKDDYIDVVRCNFPANYDILMDAGTVTRRRIYKDVLSSFK